MKVRDIAIARSGDKGNRATLSVIVREPAHSKRQARHYELLESFLTAERVAEHLRGLVKGRVVRHALPQLAALHFVMDDALAGGVTHSLALDAHGKTLSTAVLDIPLPPESART